MKSPVSRRRTALARTLSGMFLIAVALGTTPTALLANSAAQAESSNVPVRAETPELISTISDIQLALVIPLSVPPVDHGPIPAAELEQLIESTGYLGRLLDIAENTTSSIAVDPYLVHSLLAANTPAAEEFLLRIRQSTNDTFFMSYANTPLAYLEQFADYPDVLSGNIDQLKTLELDDSPLTNSLFRMLDRSVWSPRSIMKPSSLEQIPETVSRLILSDQQHRIGNDNPADSESPNTSLPAIRQDAQIAFYTQDRVNTALDSVLDSPRESNYTALMQLLQTEQSKAHSVLIATPKFSTELPDLLERLNRQSGITLLSLKSVPVQLGNILPPSDAEPGTVDPEYQSELLSDTASVVSANREALAFLSALNSPDIASAQYRLFALQALSQNYSDVERTGALLSYASAVTALKHSISLEPGSDITLITSESQFWVSVNNTLVSPAKVIIRFHASNNRLVIPSSVTVEVNGNSKQAVTVPISALANGQVTIQFSLYSETGVQIGPTQELQVQIQAEVELLAIILFAILVVGFLAAGIVRSLTKRKKVDHTAIRNAIGESEAEEFGND